MKRTVLNMYDLHKKTILWERSERRRLIIKYLKHSRHHTGSAKLAANLKRWDATFKQSISAQTNVCRRSGTFKRVFSLLGAGRHVIRQNLNVGAIPNIIKINW